MANAKVKTVEEAIDAKTYTLGTVQREKGREFTTSYLMLWILYLNLELDLKKPMSESQIQFAANEINNDFYYFKMSDLTLMWKRIMRGEYGEFYESMSAAKLIQFFQKYAEERFEVAERNSITYHQNEKSQEAFNITNNIRRNWYK